MTQVRVAGPVIRVPVVRVLIRIASGAEPVPDGLRILETMRISVNGKHGEAPGETVLSRKQERMVVGARAVIRLRDSGEVSAGGRVQTE